jgi:hypothetical protein
LWAKLGILFLWALGCFFALGLEGAGGGICFVFYLVFLELFPLCASILCAEPRRRRIFAAIGVITFLIEAVFFQKKQVVLPESFIPFF